MLQDAVEHERHQAAGEEARREAPRHGAGEPSDGRPLNPVLLDAPVVSLDGSRGSVFFTPRSAALEQHMPLITAGAAGAFLFAGFVVSTAGGPLPLARLFLLFSFATGAVPALSSVWRSLRRKRIDIDMLMLLGAGMAAVIGSPAEGALLLFLFALSGALEEFALDRTQAAIVSLHNLTPRDALVVRPHGTEPVPLRRVAVDDQILVRPGDTVPLDGVIVSGTSALNESAMSGESIPRDKGVGDDVFAGTFNLHGRLIVEVTKAHNDTALARILRLVTEARHKGAHVQRLIDRVGPAYSVAVVAASVAAGLVLHLAFAVSAGEATYRAIALLIVCSPCALVIATPVAYLSAIAAAARRGVLIKGGVFLETLARATSIVFDKTGTLTTGHVRLAELIAHASYAEDEVLQLAGAIEASSSHPLAAAVMDALDARGLAAYAAAEVCEHPGRGLSGVVNDHRVWIGPVRVADDQTDDDHRAWLRETTERVHAAGRATAVVAIDGVPNVLVFEDTLRGGIDATLQRLRAAGVSEINMLTGDHDAVAKGIARRLGIDQYRSDLMPEDKLEAARQWRQREGCVVMVGDGVNDAPTLAAADVGIAIGSIGADVALEASDIVLINDRTESLAWLYEHAKRTARIVRQNLTLAIGVIVVLSGFAVRGDIPLPLAVVGHEGSTVLVALNALRLLRARK